MRYTPDDDGWYINTYIYHSLLRTKLDRLVLARQPIYMYHHIYLTDAVMTVYSVRRVSALQQCHIDIALCPNGQRGTRQR
jgi:hypothetical protein